MAQKLEKHNRVATQLSSILFSELRIVNSSKFSVGTGEISYLSDSRSIPVQDFLTSQIQFGAVDSTKMAFKLKNKKLFMLRLQITNSTTSSMAYERTLN